MSEPESLRIEIAEGRSVSALFDVPVRPRATFVFAHGAGAGMHHRFMQSLTGALCERGIAVLRYQFPFIEAGSKRPDRPPIAHAAVRAAVACAHELLPSLPLFAGGKSFGGRMTSQAQSEAALPEVIGLIFVGFPLHPAGKPGIERAEHLKRIDRPMLFVQGTRDELADLDLLRPAVLALERRATLFEIPDADHAFHVRVASGTDDASVMQRMSAEIAAWTLRTRAMEQVGDCKT